MLNADLVWPLQGKMPAVRFADPSGAPEAAVVTAVEQPVLLGYRPARSNGRAMLVLGGGGYVALMAGREGVQVAQWLTGLGFHAFVLLHRFPDAAHGVAAPLDDAIEAIRMIRASALAPDGLGVVGLSSGGHLAACLFAAYPEDWGPQSLPARPDLAILGYAPISTNAKGRTIIPDKPPLPPAEKQAFYDRLQPDAQLLPSPPPAFIVYSESDPVVPIDNALRLRAAWQAAGGSSELHIFADAPHGFALDTPDQPVSLWPRLCEAWLRQVGFLQA
ncbi:MAG: alpha/beta hydrolase [Sphingomonadales bacterium]|nr:alpha/beta hydrolase [Sphingomonadales bacterium]MDE2170580.1 alpha/beta hydrolase [Sphingomonadales bacterium]